MTNVDVEFEYDPFSSAMHDSPYAAYAWMRVNRPVYFNPSRGLWALAKHSDIVAANADWGTFSSAQGADSDNLGGLFPSAGNFLDMDPEEHDHLRAVVFRAFTVRMLREHVQPLVDRHVSDLLAEIASKDVVDFAQEFAWQLPVRVVGEFLGIPPEDTQRLRVWGEAATLRVADHPQPPSSALAALDEINAYMAAALESRRTKSSDDLLSLIANATPNGESIGERGIGIATLLVVAGVETTASLLTNAVNLLATYPAQRSWLVEDLDRVPSAIEEVLRYESPVQHLRRVTTKDVEIRDTTIPAGSFVLLLYGSANRDEDVFERPDVFDVSRPAPRHLAFGHGIHHCLGAPLARMEAVTALTRLLASYPEFELAGPTRRFVSHMDRGLESVPIRLRK